MEKDSFLTSISYNVFLKYFSLIGAVKFIGKMLLFSYLPSDR
jgi:hypothetical protein